MTSDVGVAQPACWDLMTSGDRNTTRARVSFLFYLPSRRQNRKHPALRKKNILAIAQSGVLWMWIKASGRDGGKKRTSVTIRI